MWDYWFSARILFLSFQTLSISVSYTHLDVYKRQHLDRTTVYPGEQLFSELARHAGKWRATGKQEYLSGYVPCEYFVPAYYKQ